MITHFLKMSRMTGGRPGPALNHFHRHHSHEANMLHKYKYTMLKRKKRKARIKMRALVDAHTLRGYKTQELIFESVEKRRVMEVVLLVADLVPETCSRMIKACAPCR